MKLYLFGGAETSLHQVGLLKTLIKKVIKDIKPRSVLHVPFARLHSVEDDWKEGWFTQLLQNTGIEIFDARRSTDIDRSSDSLIFINGGMDRRTLINEICNNTKLRYLMLNAKNIVAESAGSMAIGEYLRADRDGDEIIKGIGILKNTIIEPHYFERKSQLLLIEDMKKSGMKYGVGIDCVTGLVVDPREFPEKWQKIGLGNVDLKVF